MNHCFDANRLVTSRKNDLAREREKWCAKTVAVLAVLAELHYFPRNLQFYRPPLDRQVAALERRSDAEYELRNVEVKTVVGRIEVRDFQSQNDEACDGVSSEKGLCAMRKKAAPLEPLGNLSGNTAEIQEDQVELLEPLAKCTAFFDGLSGLAAAR